MTPEQTHLIIYLAGRYSRRLELSSYRDQLTELGIRVTSRWLNGAHQLDDQGHPLGDDAERMFEDGSPLVDHWRPKFATDDFDDVLAADTLIAFTEEPRSGHSRGGRHVELGIALAAGKRIIVVGPRENVFCWLPQVAQFDTWPLLLAVLSSAGADPWRRDQRDMLGELAAVEQWQLGTDGRYYPLAYFQNGPEPEVGVGR